MATKLQTETPRDLLERIYQELDRQRVAGIGFDRLRDDELRELIDTIGDLTEIARLRNQA